MKPSTCISWTHLIPIQLTHSPELNCCTSRWWLRAPFQAFLPFIDSLKAQWGLTSSKLSVVYFCSSSLFLPIKWNKLLFLLVKFNVATDGIELHERKLFTESRTCIAIIFKDIRIVQMPVLIQNNTRKTQPQRLKHGDIRIGYWQTFFDSYQF